MAGEIISPMTAPAALALSSKCALECLDDAAAAFKREVRKFDGPKWQEAGKLRAALAVRLRRRLVQRLRR